MSQAGFKWVQRLWQKAALEIKNIGLGLQHLLKEHRWLPSTLFSLLSLIVSIGSYIVANQANLLSNEANSIASREIDQIKESNQIAATAVAEEIAHMEESNRIASTTATEAKKVAQESNAIAESANQFAQEQNTIAQDALQATLEKSRPRLVLSVEDSQGIENIESLAAHNLIMFRCIHRIEIKNFGDSAGEIETSEVALIHGGVNYSLHQLHGTYVDLEISDRPKIEYINEELFTDEGLSEKSLFPLQIPGNSSVKLFSRVYVRVVGYSPEPITSLIPNPSGLGVLQPKAVTIEDMIQTRYVFYLPKQEEHLNFVAKCAILR